jgi:hypothetical protein
VRAVLASVVIAALASGCTPRQSSAPGALDPLLSFADPALCTLSPETERFLQAMVVINPDAVVDPDRHLRVGQILAPAPFIGAFDKVEKTRHDGWTSFSVRTSGTMLGLPLHAIHQTYPEGGDPGELSFEFAAPVAAVVSTLRANGFPVEIDNDVSLGQPDGYERFVSLQESPDAPQRALLTCGYR